MYECENGAEHCQTTPSMKVNSGDGRHVHVPLECSGVSLRLS